MNLELNGGDVREEASEESIPRLLNAFIEGDADSFVILSSERGFVQAAKRNDGSLVLERQDGSVDQHWACSEDELSREQLTFAFKSYFLGNQSWIKQFSWERLELGSSDSSKYRSDLKLWHMWVMLAIVLAFLTLSLVKTYA